MRVCCKSGVEILLLSGILKYGREQGNPFLTTTYGHVMLNYLYTFAK